MQHQVSQIHQQANVIRDEHRPQHDTLEEGQPPQRTDGDDDPGEMSSHMSLGFSPQGTPLSTGNPKLLPLSADDDIEHFLTTCERMAHVCRWPEDGWAGRLVPLLTGKACSAYVLMDMKDSENCDKAKAAILAKYEITPDTS